MPVRQEPSPWILRFLPLVGPGGSALDLAAGSGRHSQLLLEHGLAVTAIDRDPDQQADAPGLTKIAANLESGAPFPLGGLQFDLVVVTNYLHRPSLRHVVDSLRRYETALEHDPATQERVAREVFGMVRGDKEIVYRVQP